MASYKKRGYKPKNKKEKQEQVEQESTTAEVFETLDQGASKTEEWISKNQTAIIIFVVVVATVSLGYLGYQNFILEPKENEAAKEMNQAKITFNEAIESSGKEKDSLFQLSLNGSNGKLGFVDIAESFKGTKAASLANYYAGVAQLNLKDYKAAINHLEKFKGDDEIIAPMSKGAIGDAFLQLNQPKEALGYFEQAAKMRDNSFTTPKYLMKAAVTSIELGDAKTAEKYLQRIKDEFPDSQEADNVEAFLGRAQAMK
ncbi:MAG: tetratricopeptide repeat protein [Bacteroidota bacterium]